VPPNTTSNMSMAGFTPTAGLIDPSKRTPAWDAQFRQAAEISYRQLQLMVNPTYGIHWIDTYNATDDAPKPRPDPGPDDDLLPEPLRTGRDREVFGPGEHPFPTKYAIRSSALAIEPSIYLEALMRDVVIFGGKIVIRKFETPRDLMSLTEPVIVNCTGLGSKALFNDDELVPIRGQLTVMIPQPEVHYRASGRTANGVNASMSPRSDGLVIGNMQDRGNWSLEPDQQVRERNVEAAVQFFSQMRPPTAGARLARSQPPQTLPSLESFYGLES
jgi:D-amino-acid oxidase